MRTSEDWAEFLSRFVHDLKTPLASLGMLTELLEQDPAARLDERQKRYTGNLRLLAHGLQELVKDAGALARLAGEKVGIRPAPASLREITHRAEERARARAWERGISLSVAMASQLPDEIQTDPDLLDQALEALLESAISLASSEVSLHVSLASGAIRLAAVPERCSVSEEALAAVFRAPTEGAQRALRQPGSRPLAPLLVVELARILGGSVAAEGRDGQVQLVLTVPRERHESTRPSVA